MEEVNLDTMEETRITYISSLLSINDAGASIINIGKSIFIMEDLDSGGCETLETPNIFLFPSILSVVTILIWICFIL